jgi:hypothetical protein
MYARAAPTAMPRARRAISRATRWRFTYPSSVLIRGRNTSQGYPVPPPEGPRAREYYLGGFLLVFIEGVKLV